MSFLRDLIPRFPHISQADKEQIQESYDSIFFETATKEKLLEWLEKSSDTSRTMRIIECLERRFPAKWEPSKEMLTTKNMKIETHKTAVSSAGTVTLKSVGGIYQIRISMPREFLPDIVEVLNFKEAKELQEGLAEVLGAAEAGEI